MRFRLHNSYLNFVECLRYFDEALVTDELMQYAVSLIDGFDDIIDDPSVGDEMKPTPVNIREMFIGEKTLDKTAALPSPSFINVMLELQYDLAE